MVTARSAEALAVSARTHAWQTQLPVRILDPDGHVVREVEPVGSGPTSLPQAS